MGNHRLAIALVPVPLPVLLLIALSATQPSVLSAISTPTAALPGCQDRCGNISIPYPFGIGPNCSHDSWFEILCNTTFDPPTAFLPSVRWIGSLSEIFDMTSVDIINVDLGTSPLVANYGPTGTLSITSIKYGLVSPILDSEPAYLAGLDMRGSQPQKKKDMRGSPFVVAGMRNSLLVVGCGGSVGIVNGRNETVAGCSTLCTDPTPSMASGNNSCYGTGCCQNSIPTSLDYYRFAFRATSINGSRSSGHVRAAVIDTSFLANNSFVASFVNGTEDVFSTLLLWAVPDLQTGSPSYSNSLCQWDANLKGYSCRCRYEYSSGNPYLPNGCQVIKECEQCPGSCALSANIGNTTAYRCPPIAPSPLILVPTKSAVSIALGLGISFGSVLLSAILYGLYRLVKERNKNKQKKKNFKTNGGLLLQQQMTASEGAIERTKVFTCDELERATDNFSKNRILGHGGQGTVYKGMLANGTIVAIKKSTKIDESQLGHFINEVVILSQINHRNVVKLLGCCLETEVPLLVYEFVPNGALFEHIHNPSEDFRITWKMRLQIALESAEAITYLHSSSSAPVYHRDIKTSNILLDEKYTAKVSDFGTSKTILIDQTHVTTCVQGTFGYIDPEFFQSNQFTDKSDVYSFGIVLVELLTSKKPIFVDYESMGSKSLAAEFLSLMQDSRLYDIIDADVLQEAQKGKLDDIAHLAAQCLQLNGKQRPTMKEVATTLQMIISQNHALGSIAN